MHTITGKMGDIVAGEPSLDRARTTLRFSIIVTFYNQREFVRTTLDSALGQGVEVIAVDDGSTDGTREILSEYRDRVRLVLLDENGGACAARDAGADAATGDYLAYLDGDDAFIPWALDTYRRIADKTAPALMMGPMHWFGTDDPPEPGDWPTRIRYVEYKDYFAKDRVVGMSVSAIVVRRDLLESVGGFAGFPVDDLHLLYRLGTTGPFVQVTEPATTWHREHARQTIRQTDRLVKAVQWLVSNDRTGRYPGGHPRRWDRRACIGGIVIHWARECAKYGSRADALEFLFWNAAYVAAAVIQRATRVATGRSEPGEIAVCDFD